MPTLDQIARAAALIDWQNNRGELNDAQWLELQCVIGTFWVPPQSAFLFEHYGRIVREMRTRRIRITPTKV